VAGDLIIGGGGSSAVATSELFSHARELASVAIRLNECLGELASIDRIVTTSMLRDADAPRGAAEAERAIHDAGAVISATRSRVERLSAALETSAERYGDAEEALGRLGQEIAASFGYLVGLTLPSLALVLLPLFVGVAGGVATGLALLPGDSRRALAGALPEWFRKNSGGLSSPAVVEAVRLTVMSADDFGSGSVGLPPGLAQLIGDEGLGIVGLGASAAVVVGTASRFGALRETGVSVTQSAPAVRTAPALSYAERAGRIPTGAAQVRVDRYSSAGEPDRFEVYIGGTRDFSVMPETEPWDMTSNVTAIAGRDPGSYRAVQQAMAMAGVGAESPVVFTGYSQGGLVAAQLAASGDYNADGLFTLGAPAGQVPVPASVPWLAVEHTDDLVPAVGGSWSTSDPVLVRRELFADTPVDTSVALPAHQLSAYRQTAGLVDASGEERVERMLGELNAVGGVSSSVESTLFTATRSSAP
jgi:hypothetical protein